MDGRPFGAAASLCPSCSWKRDVITGKGSRFLLCRRAGLDPSFPKYPMQPVRHCPGFEPAEPRASGGERAEPGGSAP